MPLDTLEIATELRHALDPVAFAVERLGFTPDPWQADVLRLSDKNTLTDAPNLHRLPTSEAHRN